MRRVIVLGGLGLFGRTAAEQLRRFGMVVRTASRSAAADIQIDANNRESLKSALRAGDVVIDAAGPFHLRSAALVEVAIETGFDVVDINDNLYYAETIIALESRIANAGIRVLSSASTVSALAAAVVIESGLSAPRRVTAFLAPASRHTANSGAALALLQSVGRPIRVFRDGRLTNAVGWSEPHRFAMPRPIGPICGRLFESADSIHLPRIWPTLRDVAVYVDTNTPGNNALLRCAAASTLMRTIMQRGVRIGTAIARRIGATAGGIGYEIEDGSGKIERFAILAERGSYLAAVAPAILAARAVAESRFNSRGLVPPNRHVEPIELFSFLEGNGIATNRLN